jgi:4-amino-4-deoxy-L-arabinose transferase-like glycosyltransferase
MLKAQGNEETGHDATGREEAGLLSNRALDRGWRWRWWLIVGLVLLYVAGWNGQWRPTPDSAVHLSVAERLVEGAGFTHPNGLADTVQPGLPWLVAFTFWLTDTKSVAPALAVMMLLALATLACVYWLFTLHAGRRVALAVTLSVGLLSLLYEHSLMLLTDLPFTLGMMLTLVGWERLAQRRPRPWLSAAVLAMGLGVCAAFRSVAVVVLAAMALALLTHAVRQRRWRWLVGSASVVGGLALLVGFFATGSLEWLSRIPWAGSDLEILARKLTIELPATLAHAATSNFGRLLTESTGEALTGVDFGPWAGLLLSVSVLAVALGLFKHRLLWGWMVVLFVVLWLLHLVVLRYWMPLLPLVVFGWWHAAAGVERRLPRPWGKLALGLMAAVLLAPNAARIGKHLWCQHQTPFLAHYADGRYQPLVQMSQWVRRRTAPETLVLANGGTFNLFCYLSDRPTQYWFRPEAVTAPAVYLLKPAPLAEHHIAHRGWEAGPVLIQRPGIEVTWRLHRVRPGAQGSLQRAEHRVGE